MIASLALAIEATGMAGVKLNPPLRAAAYSEIRRVRRGNNRGIRVQKVRIFGADRFRPVTDEAPICNLSRPRRGENARVVHRERDLQPLLGSVRVDSAAPIGRTGPIYGSVLLLGFGGGFAVDQAVALDDMQRLAVRGAESIDGRERRNLDANLVDTQPLPP